MGADPEFAVKARSSCVARGEGTPSIRGSGAERCGSCSVPRSSAALDADLDAARSAARVAALDAVGALLVRDLITTKQFDALTAPMRAAGIDFDTLTEADRD